MLPPVSSDRGLVLGKELFDRNRRAGVRGDEGKSSGAIVQGAWFVLQPAQGFDALGHLGTKDGLKYFQGVAKPFREKAKLVQLLVIGVYSSRHRAGLEKLPRQVRQGSSRIELYRVRAIPVAWRVRHYGHVTPPLVVQLAFVPATQ